MDRLAKVNADVGGSQTEDTDLENATLAYLLYISEIRERVCRDAVENPFNLLAKSYGIARDQNIEYSVDHILAHRKSAELMWDRYVRSYILHALKEWESTQRFYTMSFEKNQTEIPQDDNFFRIVGLICKKCFDLDIALQIVDLELPYAKYQTPQKYKHGETTSSWAQAICLSRILVGYVRRRRIDIHFVEKITSKIKSLLSTVCTLPNNFEDLREIQWALSLSECLRYSEIWKL